MTPIYSDQEIYQNRLKVLKYLENPHLRKTRGVLRRGRGRCCLGHMCDALDVPSVFDGTSYIYVGNNVSTLPDEAIAALGMKDAFGSFYSKTHRPLSVLNDNTRTSPQAIGRLLANNVIGGDGTPWRKLNI